MASFLFLKKSGFGGGWKRYFFMVDVAESKLQWFTDQSQTTLVGTFAIDADTKIRIVAEPGSKPHTFHIANAASNKKIVCRANSETEQLMWLSVIDQIIPKRQPTEESSSTPRKVELDPQEQKIVDILKTIGVLQDRLLHHRQYQDQEHKSQCTNREIMIQGLRMSTSLLVDNIVSTVHKIDAQEDEALAENGIAADVEDLETPEIKTLYVVVYVSMWRGLQ